jgi:hypothetical protein
MGVDFALGKRAKGKGKDKLVDGDGKARPSRAPSVASATSTRAASKSRSDTGSSKGHVHHAEVITRELATVIGHLTDPKDIQVLVNAVLQSKHGGNGKGKGEKKESKPMRKWKILLADKYATSVAGETEQQRYARARKYIEGLNEDQVNDIVQELEAKLETQAEELHILSSRRIVWLKEHLRDTSALWDILTGDHPENDHRDRMEVLKDAVEFVARKWNKPPDEPYTVSAKISSMLRKKGGDKLLSEASYVALCRKWVLRNSKRFIKNHVSEKDQAEYAALLGKIKSEVETSGVRELSAQLAFFRGVPHPPKQKKEKKSE